MATKRDLYEVLGVARDVSPDALKSAYRKLARQYHPDVNPNNPDAEDRFKEIGFAYSILSDADKRAQYDRYGSVDEVPQDPFFGGSGGFQDLFEMFFGAAQQQQQRRRAPGRDGEDLRVDLTVTLEEVLEGAERAVKVRRPVRCRACGGSGGADGAPPETCPACQGSGAVTRVQQTFLGAVRTSTTCPTCRGDGAVVRNKCRECAGQGRTVENQELTVPVPPGVETGASLRISGQGGAGTGAGHDGDLYVVLRVKDDPRFEREGTALHTAYLASFAQAALGGDVVLESVGGEVRLTIPSGTQPGDVLRVKGAGLPPLHGGARGDLFVEVQVKVPKKLSSDQAELIRRLAESLGEEAPKSDDGGSILGGLFRRRK